MMIIISLLVLIWVLSTTFLINNKLKDISRNIDDSLTHLMMIKSNYEDEKFAHTVYKKEINCIEEQIMGEVKTKKED